MAYHPAALAAIPVATLAAPVQEVIRVQEVLRPAELLLVPLQACHGRLLLAGQLGRRFQRLPVRLVRVPRQAQHLLLALRVHSNLQSIIQSL